MARVLVADTVGSAPRDAGASMLVWPDGQDGTIGGGVLEYEAARRARAVLRGVAAAGIEHYPLGPGLGQCCGGAVRLLTEVVDMQTVAEIEGAGAIWARPVAPETPRPRMLDTVRQRATVSGVHLMQGWIAEPVRHVQRALWLHGAGHVGRAIAHTLAPLPGWAITWVDTAADRFPERMPDGVDQLVATDPARAVAHAPQDAHHLILTYSHALDLALCDAVLQRGFAGAGVIGSETKWARFRKRLRAAGHSEADIARIDCPIGDRSLGKHPQAIAIGVAARLMRDEVADLSERRA